MKRSGYIVMTSKGLGYTYHTDKLLNNKVPVYLVEESGAHKKDEGGKEIKMLVSKDKLNPIGFHD